jgi:hypothetical protein
MAFRRHVCLCSERNLFAQGRLKVLIDYSGVGVDRRQFGADVGLQTAQRVCAHHPFESLGIGRYRGPLCNGSVRYFDVKLQAEGMVSILKRLHPAVFRLGKDAGIGWQCLNFRGVPLQHGKAIFEALEYSLCSAGRGLLDRHDTDLWRLRQKLVPEADSEVWAPHIRDKAADCGLLRCEPGMLVFLPDVLRATHHQHESVGFQRRYLIAPIELNSVPDEAVPPQQIAKDPGMFNGKVLDDQDLHAISTL